MSEFFLNTRFFKRQPSLESDIQEQLDTLKVIVKKNSSNRSYFLYMVYQ